MIDAGSTQLPYLRESTQIMSSKTSSRSLYAVRSGHIFGIITFAHVVHGSEVIRTFRGPGSNRRAAAWVATQG